MTSEGFDVVLTLVGSSLSVVVFDSYASSPVLWRSFPSVSVSEFSAVFAFSALWSDDDFDVDGCCSLDDFSEFLSSLA